MNFLFKRKDEAPLSASFRRPAWAPYVSNFPNRCVPITSSLAGSVSNFFPLSLGHPTLVPLLACFLGGLLLLCLSVGCECCC